MSTWKGVCARAGGAECLRRAWEMCIESGERMAPRVILAAAGLVDGLVDGALYIVERGEDDR